MEDIGSFVILPTGASGGSANISAAIEQMERIQDFLTQDLMGTMNLWLDHFKNDFKKYYGKIHGLTLQDRLANAILGKKESKGDSGDSNLNLMAKLRKMVMKGDRIITASTVISLLMEEEEEALYNLQQTMRTDEKLVGVGKVSTF